MNDWPIRDFESHTSTFEKLRPGDRFRLSFFGPVYIKKNDDLAYRMTNEKAIRYFKPEQEVHDCRDYNHNTHSSKQRYFTQCEKL